jgi:hypothetical protein
MDFILWFISSVMLCAMITHGFRIANRIAVASESSAITLAALFKTLSPEAQAKANAAIDEIVNPPEQRAPIADPIYVMRPGGKSERRAAS